MLLFGRLFSQVSQETWPRVGVQCAVESSYPHYVRATLLVCCFPDALQLVETLNDMAASEDCSATGGAFRVIHVDRTVLPSADKYAVQLYIELSITCTTPEAWYGLQWPCFLVVWAALLQELR